MRCTRPWLCLPALLLAVLGVLTLSAMVAQAAESPHWAIEGNTLRELALTSEAATGTLKPETTAKIVIPKLGLTLVCKSVTISEGTLSREGASTLALPFSECSYEKVKTCTVDNFTVKAKGRLILHGGTVYVIFEPLTEGGSLAEILTLGEACALPTKALLKGSISAVVASQALVKQPLITITSESTLKLIGAPELKFGVNSATLSTSLLASLSGKNKGEAWSASLNAGTALCKAELEACSTATTFSATTELNGSLRTETEALIETSLGTINCTKSSVKGNALGKESEMLRGEVSSLSFEFCKSGAKTCTVATENLPYAGELTYAGEGDGAIDFAALKATANIKVVCEGIVNCTFGAPPKLTFEGGEPAAILASKESLSVASGSLCPEKAATLTAAYELTAPSVPVFVASVGAIPTKLCKAVPLLNEMNNRLECPGGQGYTGKEVRTHGASSTVFTDILNGEKINCEETEIVGKYNEDGSPVPGEGIIHFTYKTEGGPCTSNFAGHPPNPPNPPVAVTAMNLFYTSSAISYNGKEPPEGTFAPGGGVGSSVRLRIQFELTTCDYVRTSLTGRMYHESPTIKITGSWVNSPFGFSCPLGLEQVTSVTYGIPNENPGQPDQRLYIAGG